MKLSKDNKDAVISSMLVGIAYALFWGSLAYITDNKVASPVWVGLGAGIIGLITGLLTTWEIEDVADSNADV